MKDSMLNALELLHYAGRFRGQRIVLILEPGQDFAEVLLDIRLLQAAGIKIAIVLGASDGIEATIRRLRKMGTPLCLTGSELHMQRFLQAASSNVVHPKAGRFEELLDKGIVPIIRLDSARNMDDIIVHGVFEFAKYLCASKVIVIGQQAGIIHNGRVASHLSSLELQKLSSSQQSSNLAHGVIKALHHNADYGIDISVLECKEGSLFQELFTHSGCGTLVSSSYETVLRPALLADVQHIYFLMKPSMEDGSLLTLSEEDIAADIQSYYVFTVNAQVVASAKLTRYGHAAELGKFSTLPRYRGGGKANQIALQLIERAQEEGLTYVFALSTKPKVWSFFERLGFYHIPRSELPTEWQKGYDFSRPSRAFAFYPEATHVETPGLVASTPGRS
jgi:N-acetylglutamate synthase-like GNAT family acetyltransferase